MNNYKDLSVWKKSMTLVEGIYKLTDSFPDNEKFGLVSQLRRAAVSIPSNIAEEAGRNSNKEFKHFLTISVGTLFEVEKQIQIAFRLKFVNEKISENLLKQTSEIQRMMFGLIKSLN